MGQGKRRRLRPQSLAISPVGGSDDEDPLCAPHGERTVHLSQQLRDHPVHHPCRVATRTPVCTGGRRLAHQQLRGCALALALTGKRHAVPPP